ncbi:LysM peptidoglycan-binding domain-containing protein [Clostridium botulinum]|uniref:LysM peptidoglycan-binding domain-containing protein n=1 Tax=Clostridium botulinum TaxID=1491 RepID=UPI00052C9438|nr:LysM domain-containing protein [Clostridium botulinum]KGM96299.1 peptidoglycan-binding protein LysM [Clostridium botulinum D str. CCUG 7971]KOC49465.1 peptidoglycan-binding protein LysM [Clostridium botulinum]NFO98393.1 LysM peptidoglycan-binding domain-containing protein [Clostridium botulinum]OOV51114.1 peptidoglycan-binding protein LysM [Clostridium botulinum D/C]OOV54458.1 peptidoglycan-binding protein LysM [Clostridium botulinum D/C]
MKSQTKKTLIIISSSIVLFSSIFFLTLNLNNLMHSNKNTNSIGIKESQSNKNLNDSNVKEDKSIDVKDNDTISARPEKYSDYIVKDGDTLYSIARTTMPWKCQEDAVKTLQTMNSLKDREFLTAGSHLMIPVNDVDQTGCTKYIVHQGENLYTIAEKYLPNLNPNDAVNIIMKKNNLTDSSLLSTGLEIYIPNAETAAVNSNNIKKEK